MLKLDITLLKTILSYNENTGELIWKSRTNFHFSHTKNPEASCASWNTRYSGKAAFQNDNGNGYRIGSIFDKSYKAHRIAWAIYYGEWPDGDIDHINGVRDDNRISNLRCVSRSQNLKNAKTHSNNKSGFMGVFWDRSKRKWEVYISVNKKKKRIGYFDCKDKAIAARIYAESQNGYHVNHGREK